MLLLILGATTAWSAPPPAQPSRPAEVQATATVRIERAATASPEQWAQVPRATRREVIRRDEHGNLLLMRIVDFE
jgi:hypothetical protein